MDYQKYREEIQALVDKQIQLMILDTWNEVEVDEHRYLQYPTLHKID